MLGISRITPLEVVKKTHTEMGEGSMTMCSDIPIDVGVGVETEGDCLSFCGSGDGGCGDDGSLRGGMVGGVDCVKRRIDFS